MHRDVRVVFVWSIAQIRSFGDDIFYVQQHPVFLHNPFVRLVEPFFYIGTTDTDVLSELLVLQNFVFQELCFSLISVRSFFSSSFRLVISRITLQAAHNSLSGILASLSVPGLSGQSLHLLMV